MGIRGERLVLRGGQAKTNAGSGLNPLWTCGSAMVRARVRTRAGWCWSIRCT